MASIILPRWMAAVSSALAGRKIWVEAKMVQEVGDLALQACDTGVLIRVHAAHAPHRTAASLDELAWRPGQRPPLTQEG